MAEMLEDAPLLEANVEGQLFDKVIKDSPTRCEGLWKGLRDVDLRNARQQTPLHVAVQFKRVDWVETLLSKGADPGLRDTDGATATSVAEVMRAENPDDADCRTILKLVRLARARDSARVGAASTSVRAAVSEGLVPLTAAIVEVRSGLASRDVLLEKLEESVTSLMDEWRTFRGRGDDAGPSSREPGSPRAPQGSGGEDGRRRECVDGMMRKTEILDGDDEKTSRVRQYYERIYDAGALTSCILTYLWGQDRVKVHVDCDSSDIKRMIKRYRDHDGSKCDGRSATFADFQGKSVYLAGKVGELRKGLVPGLLANSLAQMAVYLAFGNGGRPYSAQDEVHERCFEVILKEAEEKQGKNRPVASAGAAANNATQAATRSSPRGSPFLSQGGQPYDPFFQDMGKGQYFGSFNNGTGVASGMSHGASPSAGAGTLSKHVLLALTKMSQLAKEIYLIAAIPQQVAESGSMVGLSTRTDLMPSLLIFYEHHVVPILVNNSRI